MMIDKVLSFLKNSVDFNADVSGEPLCCLLKLQLENMCEGIRNDS